MAILKFSGIGISGIAAAVPSIVYDNLEGAEFFSEKERKSVVRMTGIRQRRVASPEICASDLCYEAADQLLKEMNIDRDTIDLLIYVSQTPDYRMPATGIILQDRLGLSKDTAAFDVNLGCSGYVYGLSMAFSYLNNKSFRRVLLLNGETRTRAYSFKDKSTGLLFGDGGTATLIEKRDEAGGSTFSLNSDGSRSHYIMIKSGGYRNRSTPESLQEKVYEDGSIRTDEHGVMDGAGVFDFTIKDIPADIELVLNEFGCSIDGIDFFLLHQANKFITDHIAKKLQIPLEKVPYSLQKYGNTSSVSIPLTIVSELRDSPIIDNCKILMSGFGVGLSWGTAILDLNKPHISELKEI